MSTSAPAGAVSLEGAWRPAAWSGRVVTAAPPRWALEAGVVGLLAAYNVVAALVRPEVLYVPANLTMAVVLVALSWRGGITGGELGLDPRYLRRGLVIGLAAAAVVAAVLAVAAVGPGRGALQSDEVAAMSGAEVAYRALLAIPAGTVIFEELAFRGVLLALMLRHWSVRCAVLVNSVLFGLWHIDPALGDATGEGPAAAVGIVIGTVVATTVGGVVFAWLRLRGASLLSPMLAHWATNACALAAAAYVT